MRRVMTLVTIVSLLLLVFGPGIVRTFAMGGGNIPVGIQIDDQRITDARIFVRQVDSFGPAWLVVHATLDNGEIGPMVGYAAVGDGLNQFFIVALDMSKVTQHLIATLCVDRGIVGVFEPAGEDHIATFQGAEVKIGLKVD